MTAILVLLAYVVVGVVCGGIAYALVEDEVSRVFAAFGFVVCWPIYVPGWLIILGVASVARFVEDMRDLPIEAEDRVSARRP